MDLKNGYPFSLIKNGLPFNYPKLDEHLQTDVAIIGAGISGALTAWHLTRAGIPCIVADGRTVGLGSTCASTSLLQYELDLPLYRLSRQIGEEAATRAYLLCYQAIDELEQICREAGEPTFEKKGSLYYAAFKKDRALIRDEYAARKAAGFTVDLLAETDTRDRYGFDAPAAILSAKAASVDAYLLTHRLLQHGITKGLRVFDRTMITGISGKRKKVLTTAEGFKIHARYVVNATGYEVVNFISKKIVTLHSTYAIVSEQFNKPCGFPADTLVWNTDTPYLYMRSTHDKRIITGGRDEPFYSPARRDALMKKKCALLAHDTMKLFPAINFIPEFSWTGTFGSTRDALPYIGAYQKTPGTFFALGFGGNGITFSQVAATIITDLIRGRTNRDARLFRLDRA